MTIELTLHYGSALGGPEAHFFDTVEDAEAHMKTLGERVEKRSDTSYYIYTERSTMIPCSLTKKNFI